MHREPFGVFADIGTGFPALLEVARFAEANERRYSYPEDYPAIGDVVVGWVYAFSDGRRQIGITQQNAGVHEGR